VSEQKQHVKEDEVTSVRPGEKLRQAREACDLSVADVAVRLKLSVEKINALERGDVEGLATPVFVAGYLRTYARLLGLPEEDVLADIDELLPMSESVSDPTLTVNVESFGRVDSEISSQFSLRETSSGHNFGIAGLAGVIIIAMVYFLWPGSKGVHTKISTAVNVSEESVVNKAVSDVVDSTIVVATEENANDVLTVESQDLLEEKTVEVEQSSNSASINSTSINNTKSTTVADELEPTKTFEPVASGMRSELALTFNSDSWAEVKDARGKRLVYRLGKSGNRRVVTGLPPFMVQLGFVQGVDISYNGAPYDLSKFTNRRSVRLRIGETGDHMSNEQ